MKYLHHILHQNKNSLLYTFFQRQFETRKKNDWAMQVLKDLEVLQINLTMLEIEQMSEFKFKSLVKLKTDVQALQYLNEEKNKLKKIKNLIFSELKMAEYLLPSENCISANLAKFIAQIQSQMIDGVKANFSRKYEGNLMCDSCRKSECNQKHLLECPVLIGCNESLTYIPNYSDLFGNDLHEIVYIAQLMKENLRKKREIENI